MPKKTDRRALLAHVAIELMDRTGLADVTHRAVDRAAGVPTGTASNYFRTRAALYAAIARRLLDLQVAEFRDAGPASDPGGADGLVETLATLVEAGEGPARNRYLARCELSLAAARDPELAALMRELRAAGLAEVAARVRAVYPDADDGRIDALGSVLTGLSLDRTALGARAADLRVALAGVVRGLFGPTPSDRS